MNPFTTLGRTLYAIALIILGAVHFANANFPVGLLPVPPGLPGRLGLVYLTGGVLLVAGMCLLFKQQMRWVAILVGTLFGLVVLTVHLPLLLAAPANGGEWTALFECVALGSGALLLTDPALEPERTGGRDLATPARWLFAVSLVVFSALHFIYAPFIATLIPGWIPLPLFWAYFVGAGFAGAALSIFLNQYRSLGTGLLGLMFLLWVLILHGPRVAANPQLEPEWTSLCVALAMSGIGFSLSGSTAISRRTYLI